MKKNDTFYTCPYCKEEYAEPSDLAHCILNCEARIKTEEKEKKRAKLEAEKKARHKEVTDAYENFEELKTKYVNDYGSFTFERTKNADAETCDWVFKSLGLF
jgi:DNA polymerase II large subunit